MSSDGHLFSHFVYSLIHYVTKWDKKKYNCTCIQLHLLMLYNSIKKYMIKCKLVFCHRMQWYAVSNYLFRSWPWMESFFKADWSCCSILVTALLTIPKHVSEWTVMSGQALVDWGELRAGNLWRVKRERNSFKAEKSDKMRWDGNKRQEQTTFYYLRNSTCVCEFLFYLRKL